MYSNSQLRWTGPSGNYAQHSQVLRTPVYRHLIVAFAIFVGAIFAGTNTVVNVLASKQVEYQPVVSASNSVTQQTVDIPAQPQQNNPTPQPAVAAAVPEVADSSTKVQAVLNSWAASHASQQWSVVVQGLGTDKTRASINPSAKYDPASVFKLYFTYTLFQNYTLDSLSQNFVTVEGRGSVSMKDCLDLMIKNSDNPCGAAMGNRLGWGKTNTALKKIGMSGTDLNNPNGLSTTAADSNIFLQKFNNGELMDPSEQQYVASLMKQQKFRQGIPAGCSSCVVADKTGDLGFVRHDVGIVEYPGGSYTISIMTNGVAYSQMAQLTTQVQVAIDSR